MLTIALARGSYPAWSNYFYLLKTGETYASDSLMDFFNPIANAASRGRTGVYHSIYPPLTEMGFYFLATLFPRSLFAAGGATALRASLSGVMVFSVTLVSVAVITVALVMSTILRWGRSTWRQAALVAASCVLCEPFLYGVERGNTIIVVPLLLLLFARYYCEEAAWKRALAYLALILAICLKLYPIVFVLLVLKRHGLREFLLVLLATACFLVLPFAFFKGAESVREFLYSLTHTTGSDTVAARGFGYKVNLTNTLGYIRAALPGASFIPMQGGISDAIVQCLLAGSCLLALVPSNGEWKSVALLATVATLSPNLGSTYNGCFLLVALVCFLSGPGRMSGLTCLYLVLFVLAIAPIPFSEPSMIPAIDSGFSRGYSTTCFINSLALAALWLALCIDIALTYLKSRRKATV